MPDATNRVLKEQSMVVRRTEKRDFGLTTGWSEDDGTTTTYEPFARSVGSHRRIETGPAPRNVQQRAVAPVSLYARRPSGVQPKVATPALDDYEALDLDALDLSGNPFAPRRSAASASVWNVLGFAALFASVLIGRVIVDAGQTHMRTGARDARGMEAPPPSAATATGSAGVGPDAQRNAAALDPELAAHDGSPAPGAGRANTDVPPSSSAAVKHEPPGSAPLPGSATDSQPAAADPGSRARSGHASSSARSSQTRESSDGRDGPMEPATTNAITKSKDWRDGPMEPATTNARTPSNDWRDGPMEPATTNARAPSNDWRDGPMEPATSSSAPPPAAPASAGKGAPGTLRINSRPWSQVFIDGRLIGNTPQMAVSVPAGRYTVRLSNPELGMSKTITIQIAAGELVTRIETLE
jgi:hypothetical protein